MALTMRRSVAGPKMGAARGPARVATIVRKAAEKMPEWVPEAAAPAVDFFKSKDFKITDVPQYKQYVAKYTESPYFAKSTGWKPLPEAINGRCAMLGFVAAAGAEIFGQGPFFAQLAGAGLPTLVVLAAITAGSIIPVVKGTEGGYLASLRETYALPEGVFTESNERFHGRLAMLGLASLILLELVAGRALL